ncbi:hypothetical protein M427DRAFT_57301 [Gonapodya prolifera JEL478]|uniref:Uncharacterized protein n=1 Tax=Gonapodya prolifera (strain JEL478) TaxID=1344416 RepID=A0A139AE05_GONPJ|nr:hypothetical protein M427DRAFT_57301 [Gonapodya prolifera JEL478]|eukprot:KXS14899.1 hypothetical protein M427DRAFT_57301 [Gonapodya prolifera JEL478]
MRNPPPSGRVPYPEDSLGFVEYDKDGVIVRGKYEAGPVHRLVTEHGLFVLGS